MATRRKTNLPVVRDEDLGAVPFDGRTASMVARVFGEALKELHTELSGKIDPLVKRVVALEGAAKCEWRGTWREGQSHPPGSLITHQGSLWVATAETNGTRPGSSPYFKLVVKAGRVPK
jgi:hypothetical protein